MMDNINDIYGHFLLQLFLISYQSRIPFGKTKPYAHAHIFKLTIRNTVFKANSYLVADKNQPQLVWRSLEVA